MRSAAGRIRRGAGGAPGAELRGAGLVAASVLLVLLAPPVIYGFLSYYRFGVLRLSYYVPYEELLLALRTGNPVEIAGAPLVSVNMTSGLVLANMFTLSVGQLLLSLALGVFIGLHLAERLALRGICPAGTVAGTVSTAGTGLAATIAASGTGILGCCGSALSGGLLALLGVGATTADALAHFSPAIQVAVIALFAVGYVRLRGRVRRLGASRASPAEGRAAG